MLGTFLWLHTHAMTTREFLDAICKALERDPGSLTLDDTPTSVPEWDSVGHLVILGTVDAQLGIRTDSPEIQQFGSLRQLVGVLKSKGATLED